MTSAVRDAANGAEFAAARAASARARGAHAQRRRGGGAHVRRRDRGALARRPDGARRDRHRRRLDRARLRRGRRARLPRLDADRRRPPQRAPPPRRSAGPRTSSPRSPPTSTPAIAAAVPDDVRDARTQAAVAVAGTATSCAAIDLALERYDTTTRRGPRARRARRSTALLDRLAALPLAGAPRRRGLHPDRAPTIVAGVVDPARACSTRSGSPRSRCQIATSSGDRASKS